MIVIFFYISSKLMSKGMDEVIDIEPDLPEQLATQPPQDPDVR